MKKFIIIPDVTCDLSKEIRDFFGIENYVPGYVHINEKSLRTTLDWENISRDDFYRSVASKSINVSSAAASPEEYYQIFRSFAEQGYDILSLSLSSKISATYNIAVSAAEKIRDEFPGCNIYCLDSRRMSGSFGLLTVYAAICRNEGKTFEETVNWLEENKSRIHQMGPIDDLTYVARRGQISSGKAFMGNLVGIKPMGDCSDDGYVSVLTKVKGIKKALDITASYLALAAKDIEDQYILIMHSDRENLAEKLRQKIEATVKCKKVFVSDVFSACGTNIGPGMIGVNFMGDPVSEGNAKEKELIARAVEQNS